MEHCWSLGNSGYCIKKCVLFDGWEVSSFGDRPARPPASLGCYPPEVQVIPSATVGRHHATALPSHAEGAGVKAQVLSGVGSEPTDKNGGLDSPSSEWISNTRPGRNSHLYVKSLAFIIPINWERPNVLTVVVGERKCWVSCLSREKSPDGLEEREYIPRKERERVGGMEQWFSNFNVCNRITWRTW